MKKKNEGITLVALVVTIIVLLILAAISLNLVLGQNGVITRSKEASEKTRETQKQEEKDLNSLESEIGQFAEVTKITDKQPGTISGSGTEQDPCLIESIEDLVKLQQDVSGGNTYENKNIKLTNSLDFNSDLSYADVNSTSFGDINGDGNVEGIKTELTTSKGWMPIGNVNVIFKGNFDGNEKQILNLYMDRLSNEITQDNRYSKYGFIANSKGNISNISISGNIKITLVFTVDSSSTNVATFGYSMGKVSNVINNVNIDVVQTDNSTKISQIYIGGISSGVKEIESSINNGNITVITNENTKSVVSQVGGIASTIYTDATNVINNGNIQVENYFGGYIGGLFGFQSAGNINNAVNNGEIKTKAFLKNRFMGDIGGITGRNYYATVNKTINKGKVTVTRKDETDTYSYFDVVNFGGIIGENMNGTVINTINEGDLILNSESKKTTYMGGIIGLSNAGEHGEKWIIENTINRGKLVVNDTNTDNPGNHYINMAGIVGRMNSQASTSQNSILKNVINEGNIDVSYGVPSEVRVAGIYGRNPSSSKVDVTNIMNKGEIQIPAEQVLSRGYISCCPSQFNSVDGMFIDNSLTYIETVKPGNPSDSTAAKMDMTPENVVNQMNSKVSDGDCRWKVENGKATLEF